MIKTLALDTPNIKITDNDTPIRLTPYNDGMTLDAGTWTPTVYLSSSKSAFTKSIPAIWEGEKVVIQSSTLIDLPVDEYRVEVWFNDGSERLIYPDYGFVKLNINQTVAGINANLVSSVTVAEFMDMFDSLASDLADDITSLQSGKLDNSALIDINVSLTAKANQSDLIETNNLLDDTRDKLFGLASGAPASASLVANMVDTEKNYVYVGTENGYIPGNWYYWDGRAWVSGGVYQATQLANNSIHVNHFDETIQNDLSGYVTQTPTINTIGTVNVSGNIVTGFGTTSYWTRATYGVNPGEGWKITFTNTTNAVTTGHIFAVDDSNNIIQRWYQGQSPEQSNIDYQITIPAGATQLYIQSYHNGTIVGKLLSYYGVKAQVSSSASAVVASMTSLINSSTVNSIERVNQTAYKFINRQTILSGFPENSIKGTVNAKNKGYDLVRVSVAFTSDDVPVLLHDLSINRVARNADGTAIASTVNIADITLAQADTYDWGIVAGAQYAGIKTPTLDEFLKVCAFKGIEPTLELKPATITNVQMQVIVNTVLKYGLSSKTFITSTVLDQLTLAHTMNNQLNIGIVTYANNNDKVDQLLTFKTDNNKVRLDIFDSDTPTLEFLNYASTKGVDLKVGSAYSIADIVKWVSMGVNNIEVANVIYPATALSTYYDQHN